DSQEFAVLCFQSTEEWEGTHEPICALLDLAASSAGLSGQCDFFVLQYRSRTSFSRLYHLGSPAAFGVGDRRLRAWWSPRRALGGWTLSPPALETGDQAPAQACGGVGEAAQRSRGIARRGRPTGCGGNKPARACHPCHHPTG